MAGGFSACGNFQHIVAAAIGADDITLILVDMQLNAWMPQRAAAAIAGDFERGYGNGLKRIIFLAHVQTDSR